MSSYTMTEIGTLDADEYDEFLTGERGEQEHDRRSSDDGIQLTDEEAEAYQSGEYEEGEEGEEGPSQDFAPRAPGQQQPPQRNPQYPGQQPTGYDPYTGQPTYGAGYPGQYPPAASMFPPGTPQSVIDAASGIQRGTATAEEVKQAAFELRRKGQRETGRKLAQMFAKMKQQAQARATAGRYSRKLAMPTVVNCKKGKKGNACREAARQASMAKMAPEARACADKKYALVKSKAWKNANKKNAKKKPLNETEKALFTAMNQYNKCIRDAQRAASGGGAQPSAPASGGSADMTEYETEE